MISRTTEKFRKSFSKLPEQVKKQARAAYELFALDPYHPSLHFKRVHSREPIFSVRISREYRVLGVQKEKEIIWFWIGSHADYDKLLSSL